MPSMNTRRQSAALNTLTAHAVPAALVALLLAGAAAAPAHAQTGASKDQEQQALDSMAKAGPLLDKINAGGSVSDQEVRDARLGMMEPFMLLKAGYRRETDAIEVRYVEDLAALQPQTMLAPATLVSPELRSQTRTRLKAWQQALGGYRSRMEVANAQALKDMKALRPQLPAFAYGPLASGFERALRLVGDFVTGFAAGETAAIAGASVLLDFMDSIPGGYFIDQGPPQRLMFSDQARVDRYLALMNQVQVGAQQGAQARTRLTQALAERPTRPAKP